jgi:ribosome biogenesis SPOUT family RNA methylase Rps3
MGSRIKPNIVTPVDDRQRFKDLVLETFQDMEIFSHVPDSISLDGALFTVTLSNKKFIFQDVSVDSIADYVDIYLQGIKKTADTYSVIDNGTDIVINFTENITLVPADIVKEDFSVKGKIVSR